MFVRHENLHVEHLFQYGQSVAHFSILHLLSDVGQKIRYLDLLGALFQALSTGHALRGISGFLVGKQTAEAQGIYNRMFVIVV